jgi:hypothetical protein
MAILFEGSGLNGKAVNVELGLAGEKPKVRWEMEVVDGPHAGKRASYSGKFDADSIKWTKRDMMRIGWKGKDVRTFVEDVKAANLTVQFDAEIASNTYADTGKVSQWTSVRFGGTSKPLAKLDDDKIKNMNTWFAEVPDEEEKIPF